MLSDLKTSTRRKEIHIFSILPPLKRFCPFRPESGILPPSMTVPFRKFLAIAGLTTLEALRQPFPLLLTTTCVVAITLMPVLLLHTMGEAQKLVQDSALALHFVGGLLLGGYAASSTLGREIRRGTLAAVLSKPVERGTFFLAKFAGVAGVLALFSMAIGSATLLAGYLAENSAPLVNNLLYAAPFAAFLLAGLLNYFRHRPFVSTAFVLLIVFLAGIFGLAAFTGSIAWRLLPASLCVSMATLILAGIALVLTTRLNLVPTLAVCTVIFLVGLMTDYLLGRAAESNQLAALAYNLIPNWQHFWLVDALTSNGTIPWRYVGQVGIYATFYLIGCLSLGILSFRNIETKA